MPVEGLVENLSRTRHKYDMLNGEMQSETYKKNHCRPDWRHGYS